jgi:hypothetical protein
VLVLQSLHAYSDREAVDALTFDLRWKAACGYAVDASGFHPSTLTYWRRRLAASERPQRIFEVVREVITSTGVLAGRTRRALDSTVLDDAVARQDTVTQLIASIRRVAREVDGAPALVSAHCTRLAVVTGQDYTATGKPRIAWDDQDAREDLVTPGGRRRRDVAGRAGHRRHRGGGREASRGHRAVGAGRRAGRGTRAGLRRHRRAVADRPSRPPRTG